MVKRWSKDHVMFLLALFVLVVKKSFRSYTKQKSGKALNYILGVCFCKVLSRVLFQLTGQFAWVVALLAGKRFLTSVWKHVILKAIRATERIVTLLTCKIFSPMCVSLWLMRFSTREQEWSHSSHLKDFSSEWISMCLLRQLAVVAEQLRCVQLKRFIPEWILKFRWTNE